MSVIWLIHYRWLSELQKRITILKIIKEQGQLTPDLEQRIKESITSTELEDLYLPYKQKRKTKASIAHEKGLEPLAAIIMKQQELNIEGRASQFVKGDVKSVEEALQGARDIIAEWIS